MPSLETSAESAPPLVLSAPEAIHPVSTGQAAEAVPLDPGRAAAVEDQVDRFINALLCEDIQSDSFKAKLDSAFRLGREEISLAATLMTGRFLERNMVGLEESPAFRAIQDMRRQLDELDPGKNGDLLSPNKFLGILPYGNKLKAYFRRFQNAGTQLQATLQQIYAARDDLLRDAVDIDATRGKLWEALQKLKSAAHFAQRLDARLAEKAAQIRARDPERARALEQEVLYYARQNLQDMLTQQAVCTNGYLSLDVLKKTCRELVIGCERIATTGMSALSVAQTVARATGNQVRVMAMLAGVNSTIDKLISESGKQLGSHAERTAQFGANPLLGIEKLKEMFDLTFKAMDAMDNFRSKAIEVMGQNNAIMREQLQRADAYIDRVRQAQLRAASTSDIEGPVKL